MPSEGSEEDEEVSDERGKQRRKGGRRLRIREPVGGGRSGRSGVASKRVARAPMGVGAEVEDVLVQV